MFDSATSQRDQAAEIFDIYSRIKQGKETVRDYIDLDRTLEEHGLIRSSMRAHLERFGLASWEDLYQKRRQPNLEYRQRLNIEGELIGTLLYYAKVALERMGSGYTRLLDSIPSSLPHMY